MTCAVNIMNKTKSRLLMYQNLSACFAYPSDELIESLNSGEFFAEFQKLSKELRIDFREELEKIECSLKKKGKEALNDELSVEYTRLFINSFSGVLAPPYESVYLEEGRVMGDLSRNVVAFYNRAGLDLEKDFSDLPNHISVELELMSHLIEREIEENYDVYFELEREFFKKHLQTWVFGFFERIERYYEIDFYLEIKNISKKFLEKEEQLLII